LAHVVHGADVRMVERRRGARFVNQALAVERRRRRVRGLAHEFDRDRPVQPLVARAINFPHTPAPSWERISYGPIRLPADSDMGSPGRHESILLPDVMRLPPGPPEGLFGLGFYRTLRRDRLAALAHVARTYGDVATFR